MLINPPISPFINEVFIKLVFFRASWNCRIFFLLCLSPPCFDSRDNGSWLKDRFYNNSSNELWWNINELLTFHCGAYFFFVQLVSSNFCSTTSIV